MADVSESEQQKPVSLKLTPILSSWLDFSTPEEVQLKVGKVELGQGIGTALRQIAAEELCLPLSGIGSIAARTDQTPNEMYTSASMSIEIGGASVRHACAHARELFRAAAARRLGISPAEVGLQDGRFSASGRNISLSYADLADDVDLDVPVDVTVPCKDPLAYQLVGQSTARFDLRAKLTGRPGAFLQDIDLPGMLHARTVHPPRIGARLLQFDRSAIEAMPGVIALVVDGSFVGIAAEREDQAIRAAEAAAKSMEWSDDAPLPAAGHVADVLGGFEAEHRPVIDRSGAPATCARQVSATFTKPFIAHASIGLSTALAQFDAHGRLMVWSHSQGVFPLRDVLADALGMSREHVTVHHVDGPGCYGHNGADDVAYEAALMARAVGRPIRASWTRAQELASGPLGSAMAIQIQAALDEEGRVAEWKHRVRSFTYMARAGWTPAARLLASYIQENAAPPEPADDLPIARNGGGAPRNAVPIYDFEGLKVDFDFIRQPVFRTSAIRSLGAFGNIFAIESTMDDLAELAGEDPIAFRLKHIRDHRTRAVIEEAVRLANWQPGVEGTGETGRGFGFGRYHGTGAWCAVIVDIEVTEAVRVTKAYAAVDCGLQVNPDGIRNQIEGGIVQSISWTLKEAVSWYERGIDVASWDNYPILGFQEVPTIEISILARDTERPLGVGECATGPTAAALGNAIKHALGVRIHDLPLTPERIVSALA